MNATFKNLVELYDAMKSHDPRTLDEYGDWASDLPVFGGDEPADTSGIWSWDTEHLLVGACADDLEIVERSAW